MGARWVWELRRTPATQSWGELRSQPSTAARGGDHRPPKDLGTRIPTGEARRTLGRRAPARWKHLRPGSGSPSPTAASLPAQQAGPGSHFLSSLLLASLPSAFSPFPAPCRPGAPSSSAPELSSPAPLHRRCPPWGLSQFSSSLSNVPRVFSLLGAPRGTPARLGLEIPGSFRSPNLSPLPTPVSKPGQPAGTQGARTTIPHRHWLRWRPEPGQAGRGEGRGAGPRTARHRSHLKTCPKPFPFIGLRRPGATTLATAPIRPTSPPAGSSPISLTNKKKKDVREMIELNLDPIHDLCV